MGYSSGRNDGQLSLAAGADVYLELRQRRKRREQNTRNRLRQRQDYAAVEPAWTYIIAMDLNVAPLKSFQRKSKAVALVRGDAAHLPFGDGSFDYVLAIQALLNFDHESLLVACKRILKSEGLLICQFLNRQSYKWLLKKTFKRRTNSERILLLRL